MFWLIFIIVAIIAVVLTVWYISVPAEVVAGFFGAFRHGGMRRHKKQQ